MSGNEEREGEYKILLEFLRKLREINKDQSELIDRLLESRTKLRMDNQRLKSILDNQGLNHLYTEDDLFTSSSTSTMYNNNDHANSEM